MLQPADLLLLDEPTNDLDIDTLEVLEESLLDFPGALVLVTHDRMLLDRVATLVLGLDGHGGATFFADATQWLDACRAHREAASRPAHKGPSRPRPRPARQGLSYREQQEYDRIQDEILEAEAMLEAAAARLEDPAVASDAEAAHEAFLAHQEASGRVDALYERWAELEEKREPGQGPPSG
jgi:ATP-binding cassette subfamily F protein uup